MILHHRGLFAPPPLIRILSTLTPSFLTISKESLNAKATPSNTACVIWLLFVSMVIPIKVPLASGSLCGVLSPIK